MDIVSIIVIVIGVILCVVALLVLHTSLKIQAELRTEMQRRRQTQATEHGLLDAMADLNLVEFNLIEINGRINTIYQQVEMAKRRAGVLRQGPYAYAGEKLSQEKDA